MNIVVCGGTGLVGSHLVPFWLQENHDITVVTRKLPDASKSNPAVEYITWNDMEQNPTQLEGVDVIVNLSGETLNQRWTTKTKLELVESRMRTVNIVSKAIEALKKKPEVVVQASAMAIYGTSDTETFDERSPKRTMNFPSSLAEQWEAVADSIKGVRLIKLRVSIVLDKHKGAYPLMRLPYILMAGGKLGSGKQWNSWIHIDDMVRLIDFCVKNKAIEGPVNASSPNPVRYADLGKTIAKVTHRPHWFHVPSIALKPTLGEMSDILLDGQRVIPKKALDHGFTFLFPEILGALDHIEKTQ
ncbi:TIGR01777 family oxidoreductase [Paenibacillus sp. PK4536]|uniref:TIGR01777 family oxidoreductase n=1 Tax=Paenibacillus TaxID=44249 RepID=UPI0010C11917|nr:MULTISPECIES: TIGR01777 family oxidoreductase [Paenibacillus]TKJ92019.1 TIGR01777 family protein [Paenibacillus sp. CFBP13512]WIM37281.1 TIGR01777 family oxidoreductase [Paenibacillus sp. PK4536]CAJ1316191.1 Epimerase family protein [Paenibacillus nuruki]